MQASSPTQVCNYIRAAVFRVAVHPAIGCRGGFHIRPRTFAPPLAGPIWNRPLQAAGQSPRPSAGVGGGAGRGGMRASRPTAARVVAGSPVGWAFATVCRGGPWPSRGGLRRGGVPGPIWNRPLQAAGQSPRPSAGVGGGVGCGGMRASRPTAARVVSGIRLGRAFAPVRGVRRFMPRPGGRRPRGRACRRCTAASGADRGGRAGRHRGTGRQRTAR